MDNLSPNMVMTIAIVFPFLCTTLGSAFVFIIGHGGKKEIIKIALGFSAGIMIAASVWGLLTPSMEYSQGKGFEKVVPTLVGFIAGVLFLILMDKSVPHLHSEEAQPEGPQTHLGKKSLLFLAITIHNIPEGMAVGVSAAVAVSLGSPELLTATVVLALGVGIQNIPEGTAVSLPYFANGASKFKAFILGTLSGAVEPIAAFAVVFIAGSVHAILPYTLSFAAGAMLYVVVEELIPSAHEDHSDWATVSLLVGFVVMMVLDTVLG